MKNSIKGVIFGLIPHIGCIAFILFSIIGASTFSILFKDFLLNSYSFYILMLISFVFSTISALIYLKNNKCLCADGIKQKGKYLSTLYGSTILINVLMFLVIFPLTVNAYGPTGAAIAGDSEIKLKVDIPCSGHAFLIKDELLKLDGVKDVKFSLPDVFDIKFDFTKIDKNKILSIDIFKTFKAVEI